MQPRFLRVLRKPILIVESLLMNARVDLLAPFLADFPEYRHDALILRYARKALALAPAPANVGAPSEERKEEGWPVSATDADGSRAAGPECGLGGRWCLSGSSGEDERMRQQHVFESAPNIALAEQIIQLCSDGPENAASCFDICDELSLRLYDLSPKYALAKSSGEDCSP
eukprot:CAMPEP_0204210826 /NCGR_PEP_ID=MMETSP0361-20130328/74214_1 /ASSEMBLY_ACC=CAM_ASM_000343 /TAXON_ID=268821 /ORGANISM="Scrippsiella Hangoei, Strain SHTV-5" /LENGTH=170 /DNA_ID=CAMNT_0051175019 /DNA_START=90 /DNA_END=598 /DNA_ORIENTATION=-